MQRHPVANKEPVMRLSTLSTLFAAPLALALCASAQAEWPGNTRQTYMNDCLATATQNVDAKEARAHCECGADVIQKKFTSQEIERLSDRSNPPSTELHERLLAAVSACRPQQ
jgi:hypothetical protein